MNGAALAPSLLAAAVGMALGFTSSWRALMLGLAGFILAAGAAALLTIPAAWAEPALLGCWISVIAAAACVHLPHHLGARTAVGLGVLCGTLVGLVADGSGRLVALAAATPWALLGVPGRWLVAKGGGLGLKVVLSWLAAAAVLSLGLGMTPTLGYEPDHRE